MAETRSGIFTQKEFNYRRSTLRIAPDAYLSINGAYGARVVSPCLSSGKQTMDVRGGVSTINISAAISPPGASRATVEVIAPQFKGLHEDYYITLPNGVKIPFFIPMQEIKIYMKGRFLESDYNNEPRYYPVFWGMITGVSENYSGGVNTFSLTCEDMLSWWKYQKITLRPSATDIIMGGPAMTSFPTVMRNMNAWEVIYTLFMDSFFVHKYTKDGVDKEAFFNWISPKLSSIGLLPEVDGATLADTMGGLVRDVVSYWERRFGFDEASRRTGADPVKLPLEMYGLAGPVDIETFSDIIQSYIAEPSKMISKMTEAKAKLSLDYNILAGVQPFASFSNWGSGSEPLVSSKLDIATTVCEQVNMEFFVDTNGHFIFKPPFYNLDVATGDVTNYRIGPEDIVNYNANHDSNNVVNYLSVTGPMYQGPDSIEAIGFHIDFESIKRYGIRYEEIAVRYGKTSQILKLVACAEMARRNGMAYTGSVTVPLRPEIRLGYPVYLEHIDSFYYVTGVNHSITFGQSATTDLSLQFRRERMFDDGTYNLPGSSLGSVLSKTVLAYEGNKPVDLKKSATADLPINVADFIEKHKDKGISNEELLSIVETLKKEQEQTRAGIVSGTHTQGFYRVRKASLVSNMEGLVNGETPDAALFNELVMITGDTVPNTDINGYRHIGAFPYGANLVLMKNEQLVNPIDPEVKNIFSSNVQLDIGGAGFRPSTTLSSLNVVTEESKKSLREMRDEVAWVQSLIDRPAGVDTPAGSEGTKDATKNQLDSGGSGESTPEQPAKVYKSPYGFGLGKISESNVKLPPPKIIPGI